MTIALALTLLATQVDPPRLKTTLPNGSTILVEPVRSNEISVQLWASAAGVEETPSTHGLRHLLEHILAKGQDKRLGERLEAQGGILRASTYRDAMQFEIRVPADKFSLAIGAVSEMLRPVVVAQDEIDSEAAVMTREAAFREPYETLNAAAWKVAYGPEGLDPFGDISVIKGATPAVLEALQRKHFLAPNLALVITGPVNLDGATKDVRPVLVNLPKAEPLVGKARSNGSGGRVEVDAFGEVRAVPVPGYDNVETVAALAAALAIGSDLDGSYVTYTPSRTGGLVVLGRTEYGYGLGLYIDELTTAQVESLFAKGKAMAADWVTRQLSSPSAIGSIRGMLLVQSSSQRPERMLEVIRGMKMAEFVRAIDSFRAGKAVTVVGVGS